MCRKVKRRPRAPSKCADHHETYNIVTLILTKNMKLQGEGDRGRSTLPGPRDTDSLTACSMTQEMLPHNRNACMKEVLLTGGRQLLPLVSAQREIPIAEPWLPVVGKAEAQAGDNRQDKRTF